MARDADVFAHAQRRGIDEGDAFGGVAATDHERSQRYQHHRDKLDKPVVTQKLGKFALPQLLDVLPIEPLECPVALVMVSDKQGDDFADGHAAFTVALDLALAD